MRALRWILVFAFSLPLCSGATAQQQSADEILRDMLSSYIIPSYENLSKEAASLSNRVDMLCFEPSPARLEQARAQFANLALSWARIEWLRVGPVMQQNRLERFLFYPDRKSTGLKQVQRALSRQDSKAANPATLSRLSVAMQGLGALEYLLHGKGADTLSASGSPFRCNYAGAIADNLSHIANELRHGWQADGKLAAVFVSPGRQNPLFRNGREALNFVLGTLIHGLEAIRDIRIGYFLREPGRDRPRAAVFRRSKLTTASVTQNLAGLHSLFEQSGLVRALPEEQAHLADQVRFEFEQSLKTARNMNPSAETIIADPAQRNKLGYLQLSIGFIITRLNNKVAPATGLAAGFSFGDGD